MNTKLLNTKTLDEWRECMDGEYGKVDWNEIEAKSDNPCYIPESATSLDEVQSYQDMHEEATEWLGETVVKRILKDREWDPTPDDLIASFFQSQDLWTFFSTWLLELKYS